MLPHMNTDYVLVTDEHNKGAVEPCKSHNPNTLSVSHLILICQ